MNDPIERQDALDAICDNCDTVEASCPHYPCGRYVAVEKLPPAEPDIIHCKDCKHKPYPSDNYDYDNGDCGFEIIFPDYRCPCRCDDEYYNRIPDDDWFCGNAERRAGE